MIYKYIISGSTLARAMYIAKEIGINRNETLYVAADWTRGDIRKSLLGIRIEHESQLIGEFSALERSYLTQHLRQTSKLYKKKTLLEVLKELPNGDRVVCNEGDYSDVWVIPKQTFEDTYEVAK